VAGFRLPFFIKMLVMQKTNIYLILLFCTSFIFCMACEKVDEEPILPKEEPEEILPTGPAHPKKGLGMVSKNAGWENRVEKLHVSWHYSWGHELKNSEPDSVEFVPMIWGAWSDTAKVQSKLDAVIGWKQEGKVKYLLGFNEPDGEDQANMSVEAALEAVGLPMGSPACVNSTNDWMKTFMNEVGKRNYRVDFICVHWYGGISVANFLSRLKEIHEMYNRSIWITEFAPADWGATSPETSKYSKVEILNFMKEVLPALDNLDYVKRYAWFSASETSGPLGNAALFNSANQLTVLGEFYSTFEGKNN
jgi:hypothetical protein